MHDDLSRLSKVVDFGTRESAYGTSYWSSTVTVVLSCPVSEIWALYAESHFFPYPPQFWPKFRGCSLWSRSDPWCVGVCREKKALANQPWNYFWISTYATSDHDTSTSQTHRRTDGRFVV